MTALAQVRADHGAAAMLAAMRGGEWLDGAALAREVRGAMRDVPATRRLTDDERDGLAQVVVLVVIRRKSPTRATGRPRDVLAWVDWATRYPTLARRHDGAVIPRGAVGRKYLADVVRSTLAQSSAWQDTADRYRTRAQSARGDASYVQSAGLAQGEDDPLVRALDDHDRRQVAQGERVEVAPRDLADLADHVARALADRDLDGALDDSPAPSWTVVQTRRVTAALVRAAAAASGADVVRALADLADSQGRSLHAVQCEATRGAAILATVPPSDLARQVRASARALALVRGATWDRLHLAAIPGALAAADAVGALARQGGAWDAASIRTGRALPTWPDRTRPAQSAPGSARAVLRFIAAVENRQDRHP